MIKLVDPYRRTLKRIISDIKEFPLTSNGVLPGALEALLALYFTQKIVGIVNTRTYDIIARFRRKYV